MVLTSDGAVIRSVERYDHVKTAFRYCLLFYRLRPAYDLVKTVLSESEAEEAEVNLSQSLGTERAL